MTDILSIQHAISEALNLSVDLLTTTGIEEFNKEIAGTEIILYEE